MRYQTALRPDANEGSLTEGFSGGVRKGWAPDGSSKTAIEALRLMWDGGFRHIPIVDRGKLLGVVSRGDFKGTERDRLEEEREHVARRDGRPNRRRAPSKGR